MENAKKASTTRSLPSIGALSLSCRGKDGPYIVEMKTEALRVFTPKIKLPRIQMPKIEVPSFEVRMLGPTQKVRAYVLEPGKGKVRQLIKLVPVPEVKKAKKKEKSKKKRPKPRKAKGDRKNKRSFI